MTSTNAKATLAPPRYKDGEAPPLPKWPINWSCVGMCIESLLTIDPPTLVEKLNEMRPAYSMAIVDANILTSEEMGVDPPTSLASKLKAAKETGDPNWLTPQLLSEVFEARSLLDRDDEHQRESQRRMDVAETCKKDIEEALVKEAEAKQEFEASLLRLKELEDKEREAKELAEQYVNMAEVTVVAIAPTKGKPPPAPAKGAKGAKGAPPSTPASGSMDEKKALEDKTAELRALLQCYETKVKVAQYWDVRGDAEKNVPMTTTRIYWCVGFGNSAETLSQQVTVKNIFQAIFNVAKKPPPPLPLLDNKVEFDQSITKTVVTIENLAATKTPTAAIINDVSIEPAPLPPLIQELLALAKASKLDHPSRKLPVINVLYEDPPSPEAELDVIPNDLEIKTTSKAPPPKKPSQPTSGLPYEQVAKAIVDSAIVLRQQMEKFAILEAYISEKCEIPEAKPSKDVDMMYYKELLDEVPKKLLSIPIIIHCLVGQVSIYECPSEDLEALKVAKANKHVAKGLQNTFQKLGHGLSCMCTPSEVLFELTQRIERQVLEKAAQRALQAANFVTLEANKKVAEAAAIALEAFAETIGQNKSSVSNSLDRKELSLKTQKHQKSSKISSVIVEQQVSKIEDLTPKDCNILLAMNEGAKIQDDVSQISELSEGSSTKTQDAEEHLSIGHEFNRVERLAIKQEQQVLEFWDSVDVIKVEKHMSSLLASPGKNRAYMPIAPFLTKEKRQACLEALAMFASGGKQTSEETYPLYKELDDIYGPPVILEILEDPNGPSFSLVPVNLAAVQRYRKLKMFLEMLLKDQRKAFNILDPQEETPPKSICLEDEESEIDDGLTDCERRELEKEKYLVDCGCPGVKIYRFPTPPPELDLSSLSMASSKSSNMFPLFQKILNRKMIESLVDGLLGEVYGKAKTHLPYRVQRYDRDDDTLLEALYADERDHEWEGTVPSEMGFGEFVANMDSPLPSMNIHSKHATYDIEQCHGTILEHFKCHLTEEQGLVWTGLPAKSVIQWEPQTTIIKDGNMILLRGYGPNDNSESPVMNSIFAILRDGLVVCFFIATDGTMSLQITTTENKTIEINSMGVILMFPSEMFAQEELDETSIEEEALIEVGTTKEASKEIPKKNPKELIKEAPKETPKENPQGDKDKGDEEIKDPVISNIQTIKDILLQEKGDTEAWRCILPTGTIIRYKGNGDAQILCRQGNVSDWCSDLEGNPCWITANNNGFLVVQQAPPSNEKKSPPAEAIRNSDTLVEEEPSKPILTQLPNLKVVQFYDPDTRDEIMTREDLVVVVTCEEQCSRLVQHADGTHIYSEVWEYFPPIPAEIVVPPEHLYDWPTSCPPKQETKPLLEGDDYLALQINSSAMDVTRNSTAIAGADNKVNVNKDLTQDIQKIDDEVGVKPKIVQKVDNYIKTNIEGSYEKKHPLCGLLSKLPNKMGVKLSDFAEAQKKHSQTWAPEGYGEAPREIPDWVWPPQPLGQCRERYSTPPLEEISDIVEPESPKPHFSTVWHVRKDGFAKVHGKVGCGTCVEFATEDGQYVATWCKEKSQLAFTMPGGATLYSTGSTVTYDPFSTSRKQEDAVMIKNSNKKEDFVQIKDSNTNRKIIPPLNTKEDAILLGNLAQQEDLVQNKDSNNEIKILPLINTHGAYMFDVLEGSLTFTNNMGIGFKVFGRGCDFESIINGELSSQIAKRFEELQNKIVEPTNLEVENIPIALVLISNDSKDVNNIDEPQQNTKDMAKPHKIGSKDCGLQELSEGNSITNMEKESTKLKMMTKKGQPKKPFDPFDGFDLEPPGTWKPAPTPTPTPEPFEPLEPIVLGPFPRLFVIHDGGYGCEFLSEEMHQMYEIEKLYNKHCTKKDDKCLVLEENCIVHTFVTIENEGKKTLNELLKDEEKMQTSFPITPWLLTRRTSQFARRFEAKQLNNKVKGQTSCPWLQLEFILPILPHIINPIVSKLDPEVENSVFVYRQILETPLISEETSRNIEKILEAYADWLLENIDLPSCDVGLDTRSDFEIEIEKLIAQCKQEKLAKKDVQKAQKQQNIQIQDARRIIRGKLRELSAKTAELCRQQNILQFDIDQDWKLFVESKGGPFQCMHKPTDLLQINPPFHPIPNIRFLFFHAEEGLRYLFICQQKENEAKKWSIKTMSGSSKSSIHSNEYFQDLTNHEETELANMFSGMIGKVEELSQEVHKAEEDQMKKKVGEKFCKQVFSEVLIPKDPFYDFTAEQSSSEEEEQCIFDFPPKHEKKPLPRPPHVYEFGSVLPPLEPAPTPPSPPLPPFPLPLPRPSQVSPKLVIIPSTPTLKLPEILVKEKNKLAREAWYAQRMAKKATKAKMLDPPWIIPQEFDYDYEIYMRAKAFKKAFQGASWKGNEFYVIRELPNERPMQVQSYERMKLSHHPLPSEWVDRQFRIFPPLIDFHIVQLGTMRMKIVIVQNYHGPRSGRMYIHKEDKLSIKFHYFHGSIAPGMYTMLRVYFRASKLGVHLSQAEIMTEHDVYSVTIKAFVISGVAPPDPDDQIKEIVRNPCDEPIDPWGALILCRSCLTHHLHWWSKNWGLYECTKCWHFHITQEWLDAIAEKARQIRLDEEAKKANR